MLLAFAFGFVAYSAYVQYRREGSSAGLFDAIGTDQTAQRGSGPSTARRWRSWSPPSPQEAASAGERMGPWSPPGWRNGSASPRGRPPCWTGRPARWPPSAS